MMLSLFIISLLLPSSQAAFGTNLVSSSSSSSSSSRPIRPTFERLLQQSQKSFSPSRRNHFALFYTDDDNNNNSNNGDGGNGNKSDIRKPTQTNSVRRTSMKGISVSPSGFLMLLQTRSNFNNAVDAEADADADDSSNSNISNGDYKNIILPIRITSTQEDAYATTSAESLTICQLLSGVDMAGAILSPDVFKNIIGLYCSSHREEEEEEENLSSNFLDCITVEDELGLDMPIRNDFHEIEVSDEDNDDDVCETELNGIFDNTDDQQQQRSKQKLAEQFVHKFLSTSFAPNTNSFEEASAYQRSRITFPKMSLDSIKIDLPLSSLQSKSLSSSEKEETMISSWKDMVMKEQKEEETKENQSTNNNFDNEQVLAPLPLKFVLECRVDGDKKLDIPLYTEVETLEKCISDNRSKGVDYEHQLEESRDIMQQVLYSYDDQCSGAFLSMALALRYKCPIVITSRALNAIETVQSAIDEMDDFGMAVCIQQIVTSNSGENNDDDHANDEVKEEDKAIQSILPQWRSTNALQSQSNRVVENIEQGFQLTKLQGALKIALQRNDDTAAEKIRAAIDKLLGKDGGI